MKLIFMGTPEFGLPTLAALKDSTQKLVAVVTSPDKPQGRGLKPRFSPVKRWALEFGLPVLQPKKLTDPTFLRQLKDFEADLFVVVAFRILPAEVIRIPPKGVINLHASLLPKYRGAAPIQWAIIRGEKYTGVTTFFIEEKVDTGDIILQEKVAIGEEETAGELHDRLAAIGAKLVLETCELIEKGEVVRKKQIGEISTAPKIDRKLACIDWNRSSQEIVNLIRGLSPFPGAYTFWRDQMLKIYRARVFTGKGCGQKAPGTIVRANPKDGFVIRAGQGCVRVLEVQLQNHRRLPVKEFLHGAHINPGEKLTSEAQQPN
ncbi:methionyl-tRNA formyltransferase [bacterium]|nr:methionyl-tRNA formyltransferase [bacterium]